MEKPWSEGATSTHDMEKGPGAVLRPNEEQYPTPNGRGLDPSDNNGGPKGGPEKEIGATGLSLHRTQTTGDYGKRPECFSSTVQEVLFVFTATMAVAQSSIIVGLASVVTSHIAVDLHMTQAEVTWISASSSYVKIANNIGSSLDKADCT